MLAGLAATTIVVPIAGVITFTTTEDVAPLKFPVAV
jgi:hypothetical protein